MTDWNEKHNWFENDTLAKDWYNEIVRRVKYEIFNHQEEIVYMYGELGEKRWPKIKPDGLKVINDIVEDALGTMMANITANCAKELIESDIDCDEETAWELNEWFGYEEGDPEYIKGRED